MFWAAPEIKSLYFFVLLLHAAVFASWMVDIIVAMTSMTVSETMILSVKLSTLNQKVKKPTEVMMKVCSNELVTWYSMFLLNTNLTTATLMFLAEMMRISSISISYSVRVRRPAKMHGSWTRRTWTHDFMNHYGQISTVISTADTFLNILAGQTLSSLKTM